jgi:hypothetical protein
MSLPFTVAVVFDPYTVLGQLPAWCCIAAASGPPEPAADPAIAEPEPAMSDPAIADPEPAADPEAAAEPEPADAEPWSEPIMAEPDPDAGGVPSSVFFLHAGAPIRASASSIIAVRMG